MNKRSAVVIVAGGAGTRMGTEIPKQFLLLKGRPILMHTLEKFAAVEERIIVLPFDQIETWKQLVQQCNFTMQHHVVPGGTSRYLSVQNGLRAISESVDIVAVHDGVRPLVSPALIERCLTEAHEFGTSIPVITVPESVRSRSGIVSQAEDRSRFLLVQTPQCFSTKFIETAYSKSDDPSFTDDATVLEKIGVVIHLTEGERWNIKITFPEDLLVAEALAAN